MSRREVCGAGGGGGGEERGGTDEGWETWGRGFELLGQTIDQRVSLWVASFVRWISDYAASYLLRARKLHPKLIVRKKCVPCEGQESNAKHVFSICNSAINLIGSSVPSVHTEINYQSCPVFVGRTVHSWENRLVHFVIRWLKKITSRKMVSVNIRLLEVVFFILYRSGTVVKLSSWAQVRVRMNTDLNGGQIRGVAFLKYRQR